MSHLLPALTFAPSKSLSFRLRPALLLLASCVLRSVAGTKGFAGVKLVVVVVVGAAARVVFALLVVGHLAVEKVSLLLLAP